MSQTDTVFASEKPQTKGSQDSVFAIEKTLDTFRLRHDLHITDIACRETICIADITFNTQADYIEFTGFFPMELGWGHSDGHYEILETGTTDIIRAKIYQSRNGHDLPRPRLPLDAKQG